MAEVTAELMFAASKSIQKRLAQVDGRMDELKQDTQASHTSQIALRQELTGIHQELSGIHATLVRHEARLDRIERRLELSDAPTL
jgi:septal ring factor EnvC (AmiA/AmiB activator)